MQPSDFEKFRNLLFGMAKLYDKEIDGTTLDAYWLALRDWEVDDFQDAAALLMQTKNFMPRPADFHALKKAQGPGPNEAWEIAMGRDRLRLQPEDLITKAVRIVGGYTRIAMADVEKDLPHIMRRFLAAYQELSDAEEAREALPDLEVRRLSAAVQGDKTVDEALRALFPADETGRGRNGSSGFRSIGG